MVVGAKLLESWANFFGYFFHIFGVCAKVCRSFAFFLSSCRCDYIVLHGASMKFWKISWPKFKVDQVGLMDMKI